MPEIRVARSELIVGTDADGRSARASALAEAWLARDGAHRVVYIVTAQAWDAQMRALVDRERTIERARDRGGAASSARQVTVEEPTELAHALGTCSRADTLIVVDCLTLWLTASLMQALTPDESDAYMALGQPPRPACLAQAIEACAGPLVLVGPSLDADALPPRPGGQDSETFLQTLGSLTQQAASACERVTLVTAGATHTLKDAA